MIKDMYQEYEHKMKKTVEVVISDFGGVRAGRANASVLDKISMVFPTGGQGHGALAGLLRALGIGAVVCGGIGPGAIDALSQLNILPLPGVTGSADQAAQDFAAGKLVADPDALCHHHDAGHTCGHHGEGHSCGGSCH